MYPEHYGNNPMFPKTTDFNVIKKDDAAGYGVMTYKRFRKGELIAEIAGEIITDIVPNIDRTYISLIVDILLIKKDNKQLLTHY